MLFLLCMYQEWFIKQDFVMFVVQLQKCSGEGVNESTKWCVMQLVYTDKWNYVLLIKTEVSALSGDNQFLFLSYISLSTKNNLSEGTEVLGAFQYLWERFCHKGKLWLISNPPIYTIFTSMKFNQRFSDISVYFNSWIINWCSCFFKYFWKAVQQCYLWALTSWFISFICRCIFA